jgi:hypothetical protein
VSEIAKIEVFGMPSEYALNSLGKTEPNVWNSKVNVKRYRITVEEIDESKEVIKERLLEMLKQRGHISHPQSIREEAKRLGIDLQT